jgi:hypothetical protein
LCDGDQCPTKWIQIEAIQNFAIVSRGRNFANGHVAPNRLLLLPRGVSRKKASVTIVEQQKARQSAKSPSDDTTPGDLRGMAFVRAGFADLSTRRRMLRVACNAKPTVPSPRLPSRNARLKIQDASPDPNDFGALPQTDERLG